MTIKINTQIGEILKVLGRTKSAYNYLVSGFALINDLSEEERKKN